MSERALHLPLFSERLQVRDLVPGDVHSMHAYASNPDVARYLFWGPNTYEETQGSLNSFIAAQNDEPRLIYEMGIVLAASDQLVGALCLYLGNCEMRNDAEVGFVLHPDYWGRGVVSEAAAVLVRAGFDQLGLHRIWATCDTRNVASVRVLEKLGMRREATLKESRRVNGEWINEHCYAVLASEFS